jgi:hypothetical protein
MLNFAKRNTRMKNPEINDCLFNESENEELRMRE